MKYYPSISLMLMIPLVLSSCASSKHASKKGKPGVWQATPIVIDGANNDWPSPYPSYNAKAKIGYVISNDKENLYISVESGDDMTAMKILRGGMTLYIDTKGGKGEDTYIHFPMQATYNAGNSGQKHKWNRNGGEETEANSAKTQRLERMIKNAKDIEFAGFNGMCNGGFEVAQKNKCGIEVKMGVDEYQTLIIEMKIPFSAFYKPQLTRADINKPISVCFNIHAPNMPARSEGGREGGGGMHGGGGGFNGGMGGGMHGGGMRGGGNHGSNEATMEATKTWVKIGLAYKD